MLRKIKDALGRWRDSSELGANVFSIIRTVLLKFLQFIPDEQYAKLFYKVYTGKKLNLENPRRFNEKLWWLKLNNRDSLLTKCSDKHSVRKYVSDCGYPEILIPQLDVFDSANEIVFSKYDIPVVLKCNKDSGGIVFFDPKDKTFNERIARKHLSRALRGKYYLISREWNYKNIPPKIVVDKEIRDKAGNLPSDYRFFCFDGVPKLLMMDFGVMSNDGHHQFEFPRNIYDMDFNLLPIRFGRDNYKGKVNKPENFEKMVEIARKLSQPFPMVRVDLYNLDGKIYFGELTFYHGGCCQEITPDRWDYRMGSWIDLNSKKIKRKKE